MKGSSKLGNSVADHHVTLPEELVLEILLRLPVVELLRFKTVCRKWYNLINTFNFINNHFNHHSISNHDRLLVYHFHRRDDSDMMTYGFKIFPDEQLSGNPPPHYDLDFFNISCHLEYALGPVNGLLLLCFDTSGPVENYRSVFLNLATREFRPLLIPSSHQTPHLWSCLPNIGFGFDPLTNDFKVVMFCSFHDLRNGGPIGPTNVAIYSLANDSWRHLNLFIGTDQKSLSHQRGTLYVNGACYWLFENEDNHLNYSILSFDMSTEVFQVINGPENPMSKHAYFCLSTDLVAMFLYSIESYDSGDSGNPGSLEMQSIDLLVMKDGCWTRLRTVDTTLLAVDNPFGVWKSNQLIFETKTMQLGIYDSNTHEFRELGICTSDLWGLKIFCYKESLVSLRGGSKESKRYNLSDLENFLLLWK